MAPKLALNFLRGQEPADVIHVAMKPYGVSVEDHQTLFQEVKDRIPYTRDHAVFSQIVLLELEKSSSEKIMLCDDGENQLMHSMILPRLIQTNLSSSIKKH